ncbi:MAG TPA: hypothetical protein VM899_09440 [Rubellimicrobium sp.]|nr:hypothetical protein [Rubellimicrobium sp.]
MAQEPGHRRAGVVGEDVAVLLPREALGEGAGDLGLAPGVEDAAGAEGALGLGQAQELPPRQVRAGQGGVEEALFGGGVGHRGGTLGDGVALKVPQRG